MWLAASTTFCPWREVLTKQRTCTDQRCWVRVLPAGCPRQVPWTVVEGTYPQPATFSLIFFCDQRAWRLNRLGWAKGSSYSILKPPRPFSVASERSPQLAQEMVLPSFQSAQVPFPFPPSHFKIPLPGSLPWLILPISLASPMASISHIIGVFYIQGF